MLGCFLCTPVAWESVDTEQLNVLTCLLTSGWALSVIVKEGDKRSLFFWMITA